MWFNGELRKYKKFDTMKYMPNNYIGSQCDGFCYLSMSLTHCCFHINDKEINLNMCLSTKS